MDAKQTPLVDLLRLHAEDLHSAHGHNQSSRLLSRAADEVDQLKSNLVALEDEKNSYIDYVGDALGQDHDGETLWDAAQRVLSERDRLRAELAECRAAASDAAHMLEIARVWGGLDWSWTNLHHSIAKCAWEKLTDALAAKEKVK